MSDDKPTRVFISYSHDSDAHRERVLGLSERLRADGIETILDQYVNGSPQQGWPRWMLDQLDAADSVLVVCTETYYRRFRGHEEPGKGKGVDWEGALITQEIYQARSKTLKFVPVFLSSAVEDWIPEPLRSGTDYALTSDDAYQRLYDFLLEQAGVEPQPVGTLKPRPRRKGTALTFDEPSSSVVAKFDVSRIIKYAPAELIGREAETKLLSDAWEQAVRGEKKRPHILTFVALGGEGKTSLVAKWAAELAGQDWPGCDTVFAWSFYSQGTRDQAVASSDTFLKEALTFFGDAAMAGSAAGAFDKGRRLAQLVGERRALLILDGLEPLQYAPTSPTPGELKDQGLAALLKGLAAKNQGLCVVTTRYSIPDLRAFMGKTVQEEKLMRLSMEAGVALLQSFGVKGSLRKTIPSADGRRLLNEFEKLVEDVKGHALTLNLLGSYLHDAHGGDIRQRDRVKLAEADAEEQGGHAFRVMDAYVKALEGSESRLQAVGVAEPAEAGTPNLSGQRALALLRLLGLFDRPATADCLEALWKAPAIAGLTEPLIGITEAQRNMTFTRLEAAKLLTANRDAAGTLLSLDAHPLLREYFARAVRSPGFSRSGADEPPKGGTTSEAWRAAHRRLYEHLCATTKEGDQPTIEDLQPLYQALAHGCQAGLQQEAFEKVYVERIRRRNEVYSTRKLGSFGSDSGAIACFFDTLWSRVSSALTEADQAWLLIQAGYHLRALGRLTDALEPMQAASDWAAGKKDWGRAAAAAYNLSDLKLKLGEVAVAVGDAQQALTYADRSGDLSGRMTALAFLADALHQAGFRAEGEARFREFEAMQVEGQLQCQPHCSMLVFKHCDLLLAQAQREAWRAMIGRARVPASPNPAKSGLVGSLALPELMKACREVEQHATEMLKIAKPNNWLLDSAFDHLTLGRAAVYSGILEGEAGYSQPAASQQGDNTTRYLATARSELDAAVDHLRRAGTEDHCAAFLTRAWLRSLTGARTGPESAQSDLDEAWEIAERGPMLLRVADIHLHRARLFGRGGGVISNQLSVISGEKYPWDRHPDGTPRGPKDDLAEARRLIYKHGYLRRKEELEDAEQALRG